MNICGRRGGWLDGARKDMIGVGAESADRFGGYLTIPFPRHCVFEVNMDCCGFLSYPWD